MSEFINAWQCIGCGKIEAPQTCIGICQDRKVQLVYGDEHQAALANLAEVTAQRNRLLALLRRFAATTPHNGEWERTLRTFQQEARECLAQLRHRATNV